MEENFEQRRKIISRLEKFFDVGTLDNFVERIISEKNLEKYPLVAETLRKSSFAFDVAKYSVMVYGFVYGLGVL